MDLPLSTSFSILLLCAMTTASMIRLIFAGEAETVFKYLACAFMACAAVVAFGIVSENAVHLIIGLIK